MPAAKVDVKARGDLAKKLRVNWTPTVLFLDGDGVERHRSVGFLPPDEFKPQIDFARAMHAFATDRYDDAIHEFRHILESHGESGIAPEAAYWVACAEYRKAKDPAPLKAGWLALLDRYPNSFVAKRVAHLR